MLKSKDMLYQGPAHLLTTLSKASHLVHLANSCTTLFVGLAFQDYSSLWAFLRSCYFLCLECPCSNLCFSSQFTCHHHSDAFSDSTFLQLIFTLTFHKHLAKVCLFTPLYLSQMLRHLHPENRDLALFCSSLGTWFPSPY